jgi:hypothetical protein
MATETLPAVRPDEPQLTPFEVIERVITTGDLGRMDPAERVAFYWRTCESLGLNPLTRPFEFITLNGKLTMYARKDATDQLRSIRGVTVSDLRRDKDDDLGLLTVYARGRDRTGRQDEASGVVSIKGLSGEALANAAMKAETKAKRRLTLSLVGLGFLDESEVDGAERVVVDPETGEITEQSKPSLLDRVKQQRAALEAEPTASEVEEGELVADPNGDLLEGLDEEASASGVTADQLKAALRDRGITAAVAVQAVKRLFPGTSDARLLTDEQRAQLLTELTKDD